MRKTEIISNKTTRKIRPGLTPESRENQLVSLAVDLAEKQLLEGTASSQVITHYLKMGSTREKLEVEREKKELKLIDAKIEALKSAQHIEELYRDAMNAMKGYKSSEDDDE